MDVQGAKAGRQVALLHGRDGLVFKEQHMVLQQCLQQGVMVKVAQWFTEADAADEGAYSRPQSLDLQCHGLSVSSCAANPNDGYRPC